MSYHSAAQAAVINAGSAGMLGNAVGISSQVLPNTANTNWTSQPMFNADQHIFNCQKVENGWTLEYRNKRFIAADLDSLMDQMKAAMVMERIEK